LGSTFGASVQVDRVKSWFPRIVNPYKQSGD
jgi:hypothetical protein